MDAVAALGLSAHEDRVEVWVVDRVTDKHVRRVVERAEEDRVTVLRTLEVLRASFLEIEARTFRPPPGRPPPLEPVRRMAEEATERPGRMARARLGGALGLDPGGFEPSGHVDVDVAARARVSEVLGLGGHAWATLPTVPLSVEAPEGRADQVMVLVGVGVSLWLESRPLEWRLALGAGALWLRSSGRPAPGYHAAVDELAVFVARGEAAAILWVADRFGIYASLAVLVAAPRPLVRFAGRPVASLGRPATVLSIGFEVGLP